MLVKQTMNSMGKPSPIIIVSGLPRSGTSMMMQMLKAGEISIVTDNIRKPDSDNPRGYYEFEAVKQIKHNSSWLSSCGGKALKMVSALLWYLPSEYSYKIIFLRRNMEEVLKSQAVMLQKHQQQNNTISDSVLSVKFAEHLHKIGEWLKTQKNIEVLSLFYNDVVEKPVQNAKKIQEFLTVNIDIVKMAEAVNSDLYRQKN